MREASLVAQTVKNLPAVQETRVLPLDWEDPLGKGMAIHSNILAWRTPWTKQPSVLQSIGLQRVGHDWVINTSTSRSMRHLETTRKTKNFMGAKNTARNHRRWWWRWHRLDHRRLWVLWKRIPLQFSHMMDRACWRRCGDRVSQESLSKKKKRRRKQAWRIEELF